MASPRGVCAAASGGVRAEGFSAVAGASSVAEETAKCRQLLESVRELRDMTQDASSDTDTQLHAHLCQQERTILCLQEQIDAWRRQSVVKQVQQLQSALDVARSDAAESDSWRRRYETAEQAAQVHSATRHQLEISAQMAAQCEAAESSKTSAESRLFEAEEQLAATGVWVEARLSAVEDEHRRMDEQSREVWQRLRSEIAENGRLREKCEMAQDRCVEAQASLGEVRLAGSARGAEDREERERAELCLSELQAKLRVSEVRLGGAEARSERSYEAIQRLRDAQEAAEYHLSEASHAEEAALGKSAHLKAELGDAAGAERASAERVSRLHDEIHAERELALNSTERSAQLEALVNALHSEMEGHGIAQRAAVVAYQHLESERREGDQVARERELCLQQRVEAAEHETREAVVREGILRNQLQEAMNREEKVLQELTEAQEQQLQLQQRLKRFESELSHTVERESALQQDVLKAKAEHARLLQVLSETRRRQLDGRAHIGDKIREMTLQMSEVDAEISGFTEKFTAIKRSASEQCLAPAGSVSVTGTPSPITSRRLNDVSPATAAEEVLAASSEKKPPSAQAQAEQTLHATETSTTDGTSLPSTPRSARSSARSSFGGGSTTLFCGPPKIIPKIGLAAMHQQRMTPPPRLVSTGARSDNSSASSSSPTGVSALQLEVAERDAGLPIVAPNSRACNGEATAAGAKGAARYPCENLEQAGLYAESEAVDFAGRCGGTSPNSALARHLDDAVADALASPSALSRPLRGTLEGSSSSSSSAASALLPIGFEASFSGDLSFEVSEAVPSLAPAPVNVAASGAARLAPSSRGMANAASSDACCANAGRASEGGASEQLFSQAQAPPHELELPQPMKLSARAASGVAARPPMLAASRSPASSRDAGVLQREHHNRREERLNAFDAAARAGASCACSGAGGASSGGGSGSSSETSGGEPLIAASLPASLGSSPTASEAPGSPRFGGSAFGAASSSPYAELCSDVCGPTFPRAGSLANSASSSRGGQVTPVA